MQVPHRNAQGGVRKALLVQAGYPHSELQLPATFNATYHIWIQLLQLGVRPWDILVRGLPCPVCPPLQPALRLPLSVASASPAGMPHPGRGCARCRRPQVLRDETAKAGLAVNDVNRSDLENILQVGGGPGVLALACWCWRWRWRWRW
jgi:hypothetical protein